MTETQRRRSAIGDLFRLIFRAAYYIVILGFIWFGASMGLGIYKKVTGQCGEKWSFEPVLISDAVCRWSGEGENAPDKPDDGNL